MTIASTLLFLGVAAGWIANRFRTDVFVVSFAENDHFVLASAGGEVLAGTSSREDLGEELSPRFSHVAVPANKLGLNGVVWLFMLGDRQSTGTQNAGFGYFRQTDADAEEKPTRGIFWPHWFLLIIAAVAPLGSLIRRLRKRTRSHQIILV